MKKTVTVGLSALLAAAALSLLPASSPPVAPVQAAALPAPAARPNVVFILTDDMRRDDLAYMPFTRRLFRREGTVFSNALSPHPLCCPARAELVTGQYAQNNGVTANNNAWGGWQALDNKDRLIFRWFRDAGYRTSYTGKLLNNYTGGDIRGLVDNDASVRRIHVPRGVITWNNGNPKRRPGHQTHYTTSSVVRSIQRAGNRPFFAWAGYLAPHGMVNPGHVKMLPVPPAGYDRYRRPADRRVPSLALPSFNDRHPHSGPRRTRATVRRLHRARVLSLYAVDDGVRKIVRALKREGVYGRTVLAFASDNGMGLGAHRVLGKNMPYQDIIRVPLMLAGPGVPRSTVAAPTTLVDLPGTLARLADVTPLLPQDGGDLFDQRSDRAVLIQAGTRKRPWQWRGIYTRRWTYVRWFDRKNELYDRDRDPHELRNLPDDPEAAELDALLTELENCVGPTCQAVWPRR